MASPSYYKKILLDEAQSLKIYDPFNSRPKNSFDEIFENCFLGDGLEKLFYKLISKYILKIFSIIVRLPKI